MTSEADKAAIRIVRVELGALIGKTPPGIGDWFYNKSVDFKKATAAARKAIGSTKLETAQAALATLRTFYK